MQHVACTYIGWWCITGYDSKPRVDAHERIERFMFFECVCGRVPVPDICSVKQYIHVPCGVMWFGRYTVHYVWLRILSTTCTCRYWTGNACISRRLDMKWYECPKKLRLAVHKIVIITSCALGAPMLFRLQALFPVDYQKEHAEQRDEPPRKIFSKKPLLPGSCAWPSHLT